MYLYSTICFLSKSFKNIRKLQVQTFFKDLCVCVIRVCKFIYVCKIKVVEQDLDIILASFVKVMGHH